MGLDYQGARGSSEVSQQELGNGRVRRRMQFGFGVLDDVDAHSGALGREDRRYHRKDMRKATA